MKRGRIAFDVVEDDKFKSASHVNIVATPSTNINPHQQTSPQENITIQQKTINTWEDFSIQQAEFNLYGRNSIPTINSQSIKNIAEQQHKVNSQLYTQSYNVVADMTRKKSQEYTWLDNNFQDIDKNNNYTKYTNSHSNKQYSLPSEDKINKSASIISDRFNIPTTTSPITPLMNAEKVQTKKISSDHLPSTLSKLFSSSKSNAIKESPTNISSSGFTNTSQPVHHTNTIIYNTNVSPNIRSRTPVVGGILERLLRLRRLQESDLSLLTHYLETSKANSSVIEKEQEKVDTNNASLLEEFEFPLKNISVRHTLPKNSNCNLSIDPRRNAAYMEVWLHTQKAKMLFESMASIKSSITINNSKVQIFNQMNDNEKIQHTYITKGNSFFTCAENNKIVYKMEMCSISSITGETILLLLPYQPDLHPVINEFPYVGTANNISSAIENLSLKYSQIYMKIFFPWSQKSSEENYLHKEMFSTFHGQRLFFLSTGTLIEINPLS